MKAMDWVKSFFATVIVFYICIIAYYSIFGELRIDSPFKIYLTDLDKPYKILACAALIYLLLGIKLASIKVCFGRSLVFCKNHPLPVLFGFVVLFTLIIRFWGLQHGITYEHYSHNARKFFYAFFSFINDDYFFNLKSDSREYLGYPFFPAHFVELLFRIQFWFVGLTGFDFLAINIQNFTIVARALNIFFTIIILFLVYRIGIIINKKNVAVLAAFFLGASIIQNHVVKDTIGDLSMSFFSMVAVYFMMRNIKHENKLNYILAGAFAGLSFASKYNGLLTFVIIGFIYLSLHPNRKDFVRNLLLPAHSLVAFVLAFIYTSAGMLNFPVKTIGAIRIAMSYSSKFATDGENLSNIFSILAAWLDYHIWAFKGIIAPLPVPIFLVALGFVIIKYRWEYSYLWASPLAIFIIGKFSMPVSAPVHYLLIQPFLFLTAALGIFEALKLVRLRVVKPIAIASLCLFMGYHTIQDNSFWLIKPLLVSYKSWAVENVVPSKNLTWRTTPAPHISFEEEPQPKDSYIVRRFNNGVKRSYSLFRGEWITIYVLSKSRSPLFPTVHFPTQRKKEYIFPKQPDIVTTDKAFVTHSKSDKRVERHILASEVSGKILVWVKNISNSVNRLSGYAAGDHFSYSLDPGESVVHTVDKPEKALLYYQKLMVISVDSTSGAAWMIGANEEDMGDILLETGKKKEAVQAYIKGGSGTSLLKARANAASNQEKEKIDRLIRDLYPSLLGDHPAVDDPLFWKKVAGYYDDFFITKMSKKINYAPDMRLSAEEYEDGWIVSEGGILWGPYITLLHGDYNIAIEAECINNAKSFEVDVVSDNSQKTIVKQEISCGHDGSGIHSIFFSIDKLMENFVEFRILSIVGGEVDIKNVTLTADHRRSIMGLIRSAKGITN